MLEIKFRKLNPLAVCPRSRNFRSEEHIFNFFPLSGFTLRSQERIVVPTGIALDIPVGFEGQIRSHPYLVENYEIIIFGAPIIIKAGYRGEIKIYLMNFGEKKCIVQRHRIIANLAILAVTMPVFTQIEQWKIED